MKSAPVSILRICFLAVVVAAILWAGLDPKGFPFQNQVSWISDGPGLRFGKFGIAFTDPIFTAERVARYASTGWTVEMALEQTVPPEGGFRFIAAIHDGDDAAQLVIGQWRDTFIIMNGDDYSYERKLSRIAVKAPPSDSDRVLLGITSGKEGTTVYLDGIPVGTDNDISLAIPGRSNAGKLVLGNSVWGRHPWIRSIYGFALYGRILDGAEIGRHHEQWERSRDFAFASSSGPEILYLFDEGAGELERDRSGNEFHLRFPSGGAFFERKTFDLSLDAVGGAGQFVRDIVINFAGFMPLGFAVMACLSPVGGVAGKRAPAIAAAVGFVLSFAIEYAQSWMLTRSSTLLDLFLNTAGTWLGAQVFLVSGKNWKRGRR